MDPMSTFYDKLATIQSYVVVDDRWFEKKVPSLLYKDIKCDYYIATRWNVVNRQQSLWSAEQDLDRLDLVIPWTEYDVTREIKQGMYAVISDWTRYRIDQLEYYRFPNWTLESIYLRLNQKWI